MFTGLVEETGRVISFTEGPASWRLAIEAKRVLEDLQAGDSLAVNGCCLTVVEREPAKCRLEFDLLAETVRLTGFRALHPGSGVNLERSLTPTTRMGGHIVQGHVDATGTVEVFEPRGKDYYLRVTVPQDYLKYVVYKGSIAIDGISLTVAEVDESGLAVWLIPTTIGVTNLRERKAGDPVNLEFDLLAKYVEKLLQRDHE